MEAYKVWVTLGIKGDALKVMERFATMTKKASAEVSKLTNGVKSLNRVFESMAVMLKIVNPELARFSASFIRVNTNATGARNSISRLNSVTNTAATRMDRTANSAARLARSLSAIQSVGGGAAASLNSMRGSGASGGGRGRSGGGAMRGFAMGLGLHSLPMMAGAGAAFGAINAYNSYGNWQQQNVQLQGQGFSAADTARGSAFAMNTNIPGISRYGLLRSVNDAAMATGDMNAAIRFAPALAKISFANQANFHHGLSDLSQMQLIRFAEMRGGSDPAAIERALDLSQQIFMGTGGRMNPRELLNFQMMAQSAAYNISDKGLLKLSPILQELGGFRSGTGLQTAYNRAVLGIGLVSKHNVTNAGKEGIRVGVLSNSGVLSKDRALQFADSPEDFFKNVVLPSYRSHGVTSSQDISNENQIIFGRTGGKLFDAINKSLDKLERMERLHASAFGVNGSYMTALNTNPGNVAALASAWSDFATALGKLMSPAVNEGIKILTGFLSFTSRALGVVSTNVESNNMGSFGAYPISNKKDLTAGSIKSNNITVNSVVKINDKVLGTSTANHISNALFGHQIAGHGPSGLNTSSSPIFTGISNTGGLG